MNGRRRVVGDGAHSGIGNDSLGCHIRRVATMFVVAFSDCVYLGGIDS